MSGGPPRKIQVTDLPTGGMSTSASTAPQSRERLRYVAAGLAALVAALHLFHPDHGLVRLVALVALDPGLLVSDPRPAVFVLSSLVVLAAVPAVAAGVPRRLAYGAGLAVVAAYVLGYFAWHLSGHGGLLPGREPLYHGLGPVEAVVAHLTADPLAAVTLVAEGALLVAFGSLYRGA